jgi:4-coumarate--CoA ligase
LRGCQVTPAEIEAVLLELLRIREAAVVGVRIEVGDSEMSRTLMVKKDGVDLGKEEVRRWVEQRLARYKWLEGGVRFVAEVPKTASGKVLKRVLRGKGREGAKLGGLCSYENRGIISF